MAESDERQANLKEHNRQRRRAERAEQVARWYFRLNGFLSIPGFVVHPDVVRLNPMTEADLIAVRFPHSREVIAGRPMQDDERLLSLARNQQTLFLLVEVKTDLCNINGPWSNADQGNMQRVIRRLGFAEDDQMEDIAASMYRELRWEDQNTVLQYVAVGKRKNDGRGRQFARLAQVTWDEIAQFLYKRFQQFPEKLPSDGRLIHEQWPDFGRAYGRRFRRMKSSRESEEFVLDYIENERVLRAS